MQTHVLGINPIIAPTPGRWLLVILSHTEHNSGRRLNLSVNGGV